MRSLEGQVALITGAGRGIGRGIARHLALQGAVVAINYASSEAAAADLVKELKEKGAQAIAIKADVSDRKPSRTGRDTERCRASRRFSGLC